MRQSNAFGALAAAELAGEDMPADAVGGRQIVKVGVPADLSDLRAVARRERHSANSSVIATTVSTE